MPLFECSSCHVVDNTALTHYAIRRAQKKPPLCSQCDPAIGKWHGAFPRQSMEEFVAKHGTSEGARVRAAVAYRFQGDIP